MFRGTSTRDRVPWSLAVMSRSARAQSAAGEQDPFGRRQVGAWEMAPREHDLKFVIEK